MSAIDFDRIKDQGKNFVDGFTPGQKAMTILGVIAVVLAGMAFSHWSSTTDYAPLYTSLSGADAGKVTQALDSAGVKWKLADGGATVLVPQAEVYKERVALSAQGLPSSSDDLSLLDKEGITASEFVQRVDYQRAMQGELEKTIEAIDGVSSATVNLTIPPDQVFAGATTDAPSAAVLVQPAGGTTLSSDAVQAIVHLVASSIPNMTPDNVTVADSSGNVLNAPGMSSAGTQGLEQQTSYNAALGAAVQNYLATALGPNHADVHVQADMNFDQQQTTSVTNSAPAGSAGKPLPQQSSTDTETFKGPASGAAAAGVLGVNGTPAGAGGASGNENYSKTSNQSNNALDQVETQIQQAPGKINRLSVAVLLDSSVVKPSDVANWTKQIDAAVGFSAKRGDTVQVTAIPFSSAAQKAAKQQLSATSSSSGSGGMLDLGREVVTLLIVALVLFFAWRGIKKAEANRVPLRVPLDLRELEAADMRALESVGATPRLAEAERRALAPAADTGVEGELTDLIENQPDEVAQTLRSWLADRRT
jgi:flagellar M-ring protein FliF